MLGFTGRCSPELREERVAARTGGGSWGVPGSAESAVRTVACSDGKEDGAQTKFLNQPAANLRRNGSGPPTTDLVFRSTCQAAAGPRTKARAVRAFCTSASARNFEPHCYSSLEASRQNAFKVQDAPKKDARDSGWLSSEEQNNQIPTCTSPAYLSPFLEFAPAWCHMLHASFCAANRGSVASATQAEAPASELESPAPSKSRAKIRKGKDEASNTIAYTKCWA